MPETSSVLASYSFLSSACLLCLPSPTTPAVAKHGRCKEWHITIVRALLLSPWHRLCLTALASHAVYVHVSARETGRGRGREGHLGADEGGVFLGF